MCVRRRALTVVVLSVAALVLATGASFTLFHVLVDAAGTSQCGGA